MRNRLVTYVNSFKCVFMVARGGSYSSIIPLARFCTVFASARFTASLEGLEFIIKTSSAKFS